MIANIKQSMLKPSFVDLKVNVLQCVINWLLQS